MEPVLAMAVTDLDQLAERLRASDPSDAHEQRDIFERIRNLRAAFDGPLDPESQRCLEAAGMLVAYLARMGSMAGDDVRAIAVRLLRAASEAETAAAAAAPATIAMPASPAPSVTPSVRPAIHRIASSNPAPAAATSQPAAPVPATVQAPAADPAQAEARTATDLMGDMMLGQILLHRGHILEEHIHQAMKVQRASSIRIGDIFVKIGACTRAHVDEALRHQASLRRVRDNLHESGPKLDKPDTRGTGLKLVGEAMLGEILIERKVVTRRQLERALEVQRQTGSRIGEALVKLGVTTMDQIESALRVQGRDRRFGTNTAEGTGRGEKKH
jgi:hypothetical protein